MIDTSKSPMNSIFSDSDNKKALINAIWFGKDKPKKSQVPSQ